MAKFRYHFEDQGQDLMSFTVTDGVITEVDLDLPIYRDIYVGQYHYDYFSSMYPNRPHVKVGGLLKYSKGPDHPVETIKYPVVKVERVK